MHTLIARQWKFPFAFVVLTLVLWGNLTTHAAPLTQVSNVSHSITATSEPWSSDAEDGSTGLERPVMIGEVVTFNLSFEVSTGTTTGVNGTVTVPDGMQYRTGSAIVGDNLGLNVEYTLSGGATSGDDLVFTINTPGDGAGTVNNASGSAGQITISYDLLVNNIAANQDGTSLTVGSSASGNGSTTFGPSLGLTVKEPQLTIEVRQLPTFNPANGPQITEGDAGDTGYYRIFITNSGDVPAYNINFTDALPLDYVDIGSCCITTGPSTGAAVTSNPSPGPWGFYWPEITAGTSVSVSAEFTISDSVAPLEAWTNTASITYTSLSDANGSTDIVPGAAGAADGMRNGDDGVGGALNDYAIEDTSEPITVPVVRVHKQIEHPSQTPIVSDLTTIYGAGYADSTYVDTTSDPNTGVSEHDGDYVDLAIGEEFSYLVTVDFPEGTTYDLVMIDLASPLNQTGGRQNRVIELLSAEVIWVGANLSTPGNGIAPVGTKFSLVDDDGSDGDADRTQLFTGGNRDVFNNPDGVANDADRYVIRITARADDEDNGQYGTVGADNHNDPNVQNRDGDIAENKVQLQWRDQNDNQTTQNPALDSEARNDFVEPGMISADTVISTTSGDGFIDANGDISNVAAGDTVDFTLTLSQNGTAPAYEVRLTHVLPGAFAFSSIVAANSTCDDLSGYSATTGATSTFDVGPLLPGTPCTIVIRATAGGTSSTSYTGTATLGNYYSQPSGGVDVRTYTTSNGVSDSATVILAPTTPPQIVFDSATYSITEAGTIDNSITLTRSGDTTSASSVQVTLTVQDANGGVSCTAGVDYVDNFPQTINFDVGVTSAIVPLTLCDDTLYEISESLQLNIGTITNGTAGTTNQTTVNINDPNSENPTITLAASGNPIAEDGTSTTLIVTLSKTNNTGSARSITLLVDGASTAAAGDYTLSSTTISIPDGQSSGSVTLTSTTDDRFEPDETVILNIDSASLTDDDINLGTPASQTITITDNDPTGVMVTPSGFTTSEAGGTVTFDVVLDSEPYADVTFTLSNLDTTEGSVDTTTLTFIPAEWNINQQITITGVDDDLDDDDIYYALDLNSASSDTDYDTYYNDFGITNTDDDTAGISVTPSGLTTTEAGGAITFDVALGSEPYHDVTFTFVGVDTSEGSADVASLTFTGANWNVAQQITLTGVDDNFDDGDVTYTVTLASASTDTAYVGYTQDFDVTNTDDDIAGISVTPSGLTTTEAGGVITFDVALGSEPYHDVMFTFTGVDTSEGSADVTSLTFTGSTWNISQQITLTGVDDNFDDGDVTYTVTLASASTDTAYGGYTQDFDVTNTDDDTAGISVTPSGLTTTEAGGAITFDVALGSEPYHDVMFTFTGVDTSEGSADVTSLTFTGANWNVAQQITLTGVDDNFDDGDVTYTVTLASASDDAVYGSYTQDFDVTNTDDDTAGWTITPDDTALTETGSTANVSVVLHTEPTADVNITVTSEDTSEGAVSPSTLTFTAANWFTAQIITVTGVDDLIDDAAQTFNVRFDVTSGDANYDPFIETVAFTTQDDEVPPVAAGDSYIAVVGQPLTIEAPGVLANDTDANIPTNGETLTAVLKSDVTQGTLTFNADGSFTYTSTLIAAGTDSFTYAASDGQAESNIVSVTIALDNPFGSPPRLYPYNEQTLTNGPDWPAFSFQHVDGVEWYGLWIGDSNSGKQWLYEWYPATDASTGATTGQGICDTATDVCTLPVDLWLPNGTYSWWMTFWGPNQPATDSYWNETTFTVNFPIPATNINRHIPGESPVEAITWDRDPKVLWYEVYVGASGGDRIIMHQWHDATEICDATTCRLPLDGGYPAGGYDWWMQAWGPGGFVDWTMNNGFTFTVE